MTMFFAGNNRFPCQHILRCFNNRSKKRHLEWKMMCVCGPETGKVVKTVLMVDVPLIAFVALTYRFMMEQALVYQIMMWVNVALIPVVNYYLARTAATTTPLDTTTATTVPGTGSRGPGTRICTSSGAASR